MAQQLAFRLQWITFSEKGGEWWKNTDYLHRIAARLEAEGLWKDLHYVRGPEANNVRPLGSADDLVNESRSWTRGSYALCSDRDCEEFSVDLNIRPGMLQLLLIFGGRMLEAHRGDLLDRLISFACGLHGGLRDVAYFGPVFHITMIGADYPRPKPPRRDPRWPAGSIVDFFSEEFHRKHSSGNPSALERLLKAPLPYGVSKESCGGLVVIRWDDDLLDQDQLVRQRSKQEKWIAETLDLPVETGYNDLGDHAAPPASMGPGSPLTFYDESLRHGYKTVLENPDLSIDEQTLAEMSELIKAGKLPDGRELARLFFVTPTRDSALRLKPRSDALGASGVRYVGRDNQLWDPAPTGPWLGADPE